MHWQLQEAKNKLSQVVQLAKHKGPQIITVRGVEEAVVLSRKDYRRLTEQKMDLVSLLEESPWAETELPIDRSKETGREVEL